MDAGRQLVPLVRDSLPAHKTVQVRDYVLSTKRRLTRYFLSGCAPELSPDELVWIDVKRTMAARCPSGAGEILREKIEEQRLLLKRMLSLIRSFFRAL